MVITNRTLERAQQLAKEMNSSPLAGSMSAPVEAVAWEDVTSGKVAGNVLANTTSVGMASTVGQSPVPADVVGKVGVSSGSYWQMHGHALIRC